MTLTDVDRTGALRVPDDAGGHPRPPGQGGRQDAAARGRLSRLLRGPVGDPAWARPALLALLAVTAVLYLWDLGASGYANDFYAAAVQAGTQSWKAMFFGSLDAGNAITVDKPAAFLWPMVISGRLFGFNSWSMLVPQALEGVTAVALLAAAVRRTSGHAAGLLAGAALAATPVAALMFRFNNPDALLVLLLVAAAYALVRALERAGTRWLLLAGACIGLGFITKMGQALLVVPALALAYLVAAPTPLRRRIVQLLAAGGAMIAAAGWWIAAIELWPVSSRPYIGGSTNNSILELAFGYNGLGRLFGNDAGNGGGGGGPGGGNGSFGGATGWGRLFRSDMATEISWLLPAAFLALLAGLWLTRRAARTDLHRAALLLFGGWLVVTWAVFSSMQGTIHPYYTVALAPAVGGLLGVTGQLLWRERHTTTAPAAATAIVAVTAAWSYHLLGRTPSFVPWLRPTLIVAALVAVAVVLGWAVLAWRGQGLPGGRSLRALGVAGLVAACIAVFGGTAAYAVDTASQPHSGSIPSSGPVGAGGPGMGFGGGSVPAGGAFPGRAGGGDASSNDSNLVALLERTDTRWSAATIGSQSAAPLQLASGRAVMSIGGFNGGDNSPTLEQFKAYVASGQVRYFIASGGAGGVAFGGGAGFGGGPAADGNAGGGSAADGNAGSPFTGGSGQPAGGDTMPSAPGGSAPGGGTGDLPAFGDGGGRAGAVPGGGVGFGGGGPGGGSGSEISSWVASTFSSSTVGGVTVYDLTSPVAGGGGA